MNECLFSGRLTAAPATEVVNEISKAILCIAVKRDYKNSVGQYDSDFIYINAWKNSAVYAARYLKKGDLVEVICSYRSKPYKKEDGTRGIYRSLECKSIKCLLKAKHDEAESEDLPEFIFEDDVFFAET